MALTVQLTAAPRASNAMTFGIAKLGFKTSGSSGFGPTPGSWGLNEHNRSSTAGGQLCYHDGTKRETLASFRSLREGDELTIRYERRLGKAWLYINKSELVQEFQVHGPGEAPELVLGATYCSDHALQITTDTVLPALPASAKKAAEKPTKVG